jgi:hypothetical protein
LKKPIDKINATVIDKYPNINIKSFIISRFFYENNELKKDIIYDKNGLPEDLCYFNKPAEPAIL